MDANPCKRARKCYMSNVALGVYGVRRPVEEFCAVKSARRECVRVRRRRRASLPPAVRGPTRFPTDQFLPQRDAAEETRRWCGRRFVARAAGRSPVFFFSLFSVTTCVRASSLSLFLSRRARAFALRVFWRAPGHGVGAWIQSGPDRPSRVRYSPKSASDSLFPAYASL